MRAGDDAVLPTAWWLSSAGLVLRHPSLWITALRALLRLATPGWWRRPPFLPFPDERYIRFRFETQYGSQEPAPHDLITYLRWLRRMGRTR